MKAKKSGFSAYLTKPIKQRNLYECLSNLMSIKNKNNKNKSREIITKYTLKEIQDNNIHILLVENNVVNQKLAKMLLEKKGYKVTISNNGKEAIKTLEKTDFHIVLMDVQMPEMDGYETTNIIRNSESKVLNHNIPVIAMTAHAMKGDRGKCMKERMDDYITKPIQSNILFNTIHKYLNLSNKPV